ncbi:MAG: hypothetical protein JWL84_4850 [Rhodospirillales bacterium]|jgi:hypothetical protein|nr:hypothetical protein [Rhodospirillales bacterium]
MFRPSFNACKKLEQALIAMAQNAEKIGHSELSREARVRLRNAARRSPSSERHGPGAGASTIDEMLLVKRLSHFSGYDSGAAANLLVQYAYSFDPFRPQQECWRSMPHSTLKRAGQQGGSGVGETKEERMKANYMERREQQIRRRAYAIWQEEGEPEGRELDHWLRAEREVPVETELDSGSSSDA